MSLYDESHFDSHQLSELLQLINANWKNIMKNWSDQRICDHGKMSYLLTKFLRARNQREKETKAHSSEK
jgi:hypothetical protein